MYTYEYIKMTYVKIFKGHGRLCKCFFSNLSIYRIWENRVYSLYLNPRKKELKSNECVERLPVNWFAWESIRWMHAHFAVGDIEYEDLQAAWLLSSN